MCGFRNPVCFPFLLQTDSLICLHRSWHLVSGRSTKTRTQHDFMSSYNCRFVRATACTFRQTTYPHLSFPKASGFHILSHFLFRTTPLLHPQKGCCVFLHIFCFDWMLCPVFSTAVHSVCIIEGVQTAASLECTSANFVYMAGNLDVCQATASQKRTLPDGCHTVWQGDAG